MKNVRPFYEEKAGIPQHVIQCNESLARMVADVHGYDCSEVSTQKPYYLLGRPLQRQIAATNGIETKDDFYGALVDHIPHADKAVLHRTIPNPNHVPQFYSEKFAKAVQEIVLPGYSVFTYEDTITAFLILSKEVGVVRLKDPCASGCKKQFTIKNSTELKKILEAHFKPFPHKTGLVIEQNVSAPQTITGGYAIFPSKTYDFVGKQIETTIQNKNRAEPAYGGIDLLVTQRHNPRHIALTRTTYINDPIYQSLYEALKVAYNAYEELVPLCTRISFDMVVGYDNKNNLIYGITDPTLRLGGSDQAVMSAMEHLKDGVESIIMQTRIAYEGQQIAFEGKRLADTQEITMITGVAPDQQTTLIGNAQLSA